MFTQCLICNGRLTSPVIEASNSDLTIACWICGNFILSEEVALTLPHARGIERYLLSAIIRERNLDKTLPKIKDLEAFIASVRIPHGPIEKRDKLLLFLYRNMETLDKYIPINEQTDYPITYSKTPSEFNYIKKSAIDNSLIEMSSNEGIRLRISGWERVDFLRQKQVKSNQAFVAMHFQDDLRDVLEQGFKPALKASGYVALRIDELEHNDMITDRMIAEIRRSGLLIADCTNQRHNVYFEAGFAMGLGVPVIWTCKESDIANLHFDTKPFNFIAWRDIADLRKKLADRIDATLPAASNR